MVAIIQKVLLKIGYKSPKVLPREKNEYCMLSFCVITSIGTLVIISKGLTVTWSYNMTIKYNNTVMNRQEDKQPKKYISSISF